MKLILVANPFFDGFIVNVSDCIDVMLPLYSFNLLSERKRQFVEVACIKSWLPELISKSREVGPYGFELEVLVELLIVEKFNHFVSLVFYS